MAMCGRAERRTKSTTATLMPSTKPPSTPMARTPPNVARCAATSSRWKRHCSASAEKSRRPTTDAMTMAARAAWGRGANSGVSQSKVAAMAATHTRPLTGVRAPAALFALEREKLPATG